MQADNRSNLGRNAFWIPISGVVAELEIHAIEERMIVRVRQHEEFTQLETID